VTSCAVYTVHKEMRSASFLVEPQNQGRWFVSSLASKILGWFVSGLASKTLGQFSLVWPQNRWRWFLPVWPQNRWLGFPSLGLKTGSYGLVIWASKSPQWFLGLALKTMQASVCRLLHKINGGRMAWNTQ
jgi:hypothetical protein